MPPDNRQVRKVSVSANEEIYFYGPDGRKVAAYHLEVSGSSMWFVENSRELYFAGKRIMSGSAMVADDRIGTIAMSGNAALGGYYPYGENAGGFATYALDTTTNLHYADQRYYSPGVGRFLTADPYRASGGPADPGSWNRYSYTVGDLINLNDPNGLVYCWVERTIFSRTGSFAHVLCQSNAGAIVGDANYAVDARPNDPGRLEREEYRVLGDAAADFKEADPNDWDLVPAAASRAIQALTLNKECFELFGTVETRQGRWNPVTVITSMFFQRNGEYGTVDFEYRGVGVAETRPAGFRFPNPFDRDLISSRRANISIHRNYWNGYGSEQNAETILHELGHLFNFSLGSGGFVLSNLVKGRDPAAFDTLIKAKCNLQIP